MTKGQRFAAAYFNKQATGYQPTEQDLGESVDAFLNEQSEGANRLLEWRRACQDQLDSLIRYMIENGLKAAYRVFLFKGERCHVSLTTGDAAADYAAKNHLIPKDLID